MAIAKDFQRVWSNTHTPDRELCWKALAGLLRAAACPGSTLARKTTASDTTTAKHRAGMFSPMDATRGVLAGRYGIKACKIHDARISPPRIPATANGITAGGAVTYREARGSA